MCTTIKRLTDTQLLRVKEHPEYRVIVNYPFNVVNVQSKDDMLLSWFAKSFKGLGITIKESADAHSDIPYGSDYSIGYSAIPHEDYGYGDSLFVVYVLEAAHEFCFTTHFGKVVKDYPLDLGSLIVFDPGEPHWVNPTCVTKSTKDMKPFVLLVMPIMSEEIDKLKPFINPNGISIDMEKLDN